jgi:hypothetical protein
MKKCLNCRWLRWVGKTWLTKRGEISQDAKVKCDAMTFDMAYKFYNKQDQALDSLSHRSVKRLIYGCKLFENVGV